MPSTNSQLTNPDPFIVNKQQCEAIICSFLQGQGFDLKVIDSRNDADLQAAKAGHKLLIETRGNQAMAHDANTVFDSTQISIHLAEQIQLMMKLYEHIDDRTVLAIANPDTPRIRQQVERLNKALSDLKIVRFWVQKDKMTVTAEYPESLAERMQQLGFPL
ncbi:hypothetical protein [Paenibacillus whitsoniae]|uniref:Uncharacterized protein n=1 Tax=Paenibacillus whitsoniae TaxID=2496558 RepID=A0A3S0BJ83_9BACL|nr:hypothetical protein [Paenibacillus whitsoniae]RTE07825.1 hypothetical protein EJQ19_20485 [Paenibacillus whitsoniae]